MTTTASPKKFGPVEWPSSVLETVYNCPTDNNDSPVTKETVQGWIKYFNERTHEFRDSHKGILAQIQGTL